MQAASPSERGPSAPSLRMVTGVLGVPPRRYSTPRNCCCCRSASAGTLLNTTDLPSSPLTWATKTSNERTWQLRTDLTWPASMASAIEPGTNLQGSLPRGLDRRGVPQWEELLQQRQGTAVGQRGAHRGNNPLILRRATVRHDLRHGRDRAPAGDTAPAW